MIVSRPLPTSSSEVQPSTFAHSGFALLTRPMVLRFALAMMMQGLTLLKSRMRVSLAIIWFVCSDAWMLFAFAMMRSASSCSFITESR